MGLFILLSVSLDGRGIYVVLVLSCTCETCRYQPVMGDTDTTNNHHSSRITCLSNEMQIHLTFQGSKDGILKNMIYFLFMFQT